MPSCEREQEKKEVKKKKTTHLPRDFLLARDLLALGPGFKLHPTSVDTPAVTPRVVEFFVPAKLPRTEKLAK